MSAPTTRDADPRLRPSGVPAWPGRSRRGELAAAAGVAAVVLHLIFAQVTLVLLLCLLVVGRISRWRPLWLAAPAAAGTVWVAAIGAPRAAAGFVAGPGHVAAYLAGALGHPGRLGHLLAAFSGVGHWLPRQLPLALAAAAAEAAIADWLGRLSRRGRAGRERAPGDAELYRPGLVVAIRGRLTAAALAAGEVVSRDGCGLGLDGASGRAVELSWADAAGGVLLTCGDPRAGARASFPLAYAAVRRRKTVIVVDLSGSRWLGAALTAACDRIDAPLARFGPDGPGCYDPFADHPPSLAASLVSELIDWSGATEQQRQAGRRSLAAAFAVLATGPPRPCALDGLIDVLEPAALRGQLAQLRGSPFGRWLAAPAGQAEQAGAISLDRAVRERGGVLFSLDHGTQPEAAAMVARLAVADLVAVLRDLSDLRVQGDALVWIHGCEAVARQALTELLALGPTVGAAVLLSTSNAVAAASLAAVAGVVVTAGPADQVLATRLAELAAFTREDSHQDMAELLRWQEEDEFAVIGRGPQPRFQPGCRLVPAAWARLR
jgi:hypothetical protein